MTFTALISAILVTLTSVATPAPACGSFIPCGVYVGTSVEDRSDGSARHLEERLTLAAIDGQPSAVRLTLITTEPETGANRAWVEDLVFHQSGAFTMRDPGEGKGDGISGFGVCRVSRCTYAFRPDVAMISGALYFGNGRTFLTVNEIIDGGEVSTRYARLKAR